MSLPGGGAGAEYKPMNKRKTVFEVEGVLVGDGRPWEEVRLNGFPSHAAFRALSTDPTWLEHQPDRAAALADTYALMTLPLVDSLATP